MTSLSSSAANPMDEVVYLLSLSPTLSSVYFFPLFFASRLSSSCSAACVLTGCCSPFLCCHLCHHSLSSRPPSVPLFTLGTSQSHAQWAFFVVAGLRCARRSSSVSVMYIVSIWTVFFGSPLKQTSILH